MTELIFFETVATATLFWGLILISVACVGGGFAFWVFQFPEFLSWRKRCLTGVFGAALVFVAIFNPDSLNGISLRGGISSSRTGKDTTSRQDIGSATIIVNNVLSPDQVWEDVDVYIDGKFSGRLQVDMNEREANLRVNLPYRRGTAFYEVIGHERSYAMRQRDVYGIGDLKVEDGLVYWLNGVRANSFTVSVRLQPAPFGFLHHK